MASNIEEYKAKENNPFKATMFSGLCLREFAFMVRRTIMDLEKTTGSVNCVQNMVGGCCGVAETPFEERKRLSAIRDSVKEVENNVMLLQRMSSWQEMHRNAAFTSLEESRQSLLSKVAYYEGRQLEVVTELNSCFGNGNNVPFNWDFRERLKKKKDESGVQNRRFFTNCIRKLLFSWQWRKGVGIGVKLLMSISSVMAACHCRKLLYTNSRKVIIPFWVPTKERRSGCLLTFSENPLDVFCGKG